MDTNNILERLRILETIEPKAKEPAAPLTDTLPEPWLQWSEVSDTNETPEYLVKTVLPRTGLGVMFGESGCGKTFLALDMAAHIAAGRAWQGCRVQQHAVVYIAAEGAGGIGKRIRAFKKEHPDFPTDLPFLICPAPINLYDPEPGALRRLIGTIRQWAGRCGIAVGLVIIDTLARAIAGGDENSSAGMSALIAHASWLGEELGAFVCLIHHAGKDTSKGARGHSSLRAAVDTEIEVTKAAGSTTATLTKSRDDETGRTFGFRLKRVTLGTDTEGDEVTSCVVEHTEVSDKRKNLSPQEHLALQELLNLSEEAIPLPNTPEYPSGKQYRGVYLDRWRERFYKRVVPDALPDTQRKTFQRLRAKLQRSGHIGLYDKLVWHIPRPENRGEQ